MKQAVVTGGAGFIGSHLVDALLENGYRVICLDRFSQGISQHFISPLHKKNLLCIQVDFSARNMLDLDYVFSEGCIVFHLASLTDVSNAQKYPFVCHDINVGATALILEYARRKKVKKFIYTSTASCYGTSVINPINELHELSLETIYALSKRTAEEYILQWNLVYKIPTLILRLFHVYGVKNRQYGGWGHMLTQCISSLQSNKPCRISGDGSWERDFTYVSDVVDACMVSAESEVERDIINIATGDPHSMNDFVSLLGMDRVYIPSLEVRPQSLYADVRKAQQVLRWSHRVSLADGLMRVRESVYQSTSSIG